jgi:hypothetical protein
MPLALASVLIGGTAIAAASGVNFESGPFGWQSDGAGRDTFWDSSVPDNVHHMAEHLLHLQTETGDDAAAERSARWAYEIAIATLTGDRGRGAADYNLGCYYAVRARLDEAMPYLLRGMELRPDLRDWAKQDSDLELIRARADLAGELGLET